MAVGSQEFREALGRFATGVAVVTAQTEEGEAVGVTVNSLTSVSLDPPLVLICLDRKMTAIEAFSRGQHFAINVLAENQQALSERFAFRRHSGFEGVAFETWNGGCPVIDGCVANLECSRFEVHSGGDHLIVVGRVERIRTSDRKPLLYFRGDYDGLCGTLQGA